MAGSLPLGVGGSEGVIGAARGLGLLLGSSLRGFGLCFGGVNGLGPWLCSNEDEPRSESPLGSTLVGIDSDEEVGVGVGDGRIRSIFGEMVGE